MLFIKTDVNNVQSDEIIEERIRGIIKNSVKIKSDYIKKKLNIDQKQFIEILDISLREYNRYALSGQICSSYSDLIDKLNIIIKNIDKR